MKIKCPYRGLQPLSKADQPYFAGREKDVRIILSNIYGSPLTVLYGESGVGKTSLIRAGLLPELERDNRAAAILFRDWQSPDFERQLRDQVLQSLVDSINRFRHQTDSAEEPLTIDKLKKAFCVGLELSAPEELYTLPFHRFIQESSAAFYGKVFFIFDQFEEYIYYHPLKTDGDRFDSALASAINDRQISASFLLSLREDGLGKLDRLRGRIPELLGNIFRLEHLDRDGARRAIERPLEVFSYGKSFIVEAAPELKETLLDQVDADLLEMDEAGEAGASDFRQGDSGVRYKAVALQAVLTQLWNVDVDPLLKDNITPTGVIWLNLQTLLALAKNKKEPDETEVRCLVRTYFDEKLNLLDPDEAAMGAEIFRGLVRAGGHKRARTATSLAKETTFSKDKVEALLIKLSSDPFLILRSLEGSRETLYELNHDVMAFAIMDWSNRQRLTLHNKRLKRRVAYSLLAVAALSGAGLYFLSEHQRRVNEERLASERAQLMAQSLKFESESRALQKVIQSAAARLDMPTGLDANMPNAEIGTLAAIDAIARCRTAKLFVSPRYALVLQFATAYTKDSKAIIDPTSLREQLPGVESADGENMLVKTEGDVQLINSKGETFPLQVHTAVTSMGFDAKGQRFGVNQVDGKIITGTIANTGTISNLIVREHPSSPLTKELDIPQGPAPEWFAVAPKDRPWDQSYDAVVNKVVLDGVSGVTRTYPGQERFKVGMSEQTFTDKVIKAYEVALAGKVDEATQRLQKALQEVSLDFGIYKVKETLAGNLFNRAIKEPDQGERQNYFNLALQFDPGIQRNIDAFEQRDKIKSLIETGNQYVGERNYSEATKVFQKAIEIDPNLGTVEQQLQDAKQRLASEWMQKGNDYAKNNNPEGAKQAYLKAIDYDPALKYQVNPGTEGTKFAPGVQSPTPGPP